MHNIVSTINDLINRTPRRHNDDNVKEINNIIAEYEDVLIEIEAINSHYEKLVPPYFDTLEDIKADIKKSGDRKASKGTKDSYFNEASGNLKETMQELIDAFGDGDLH